MIQFKFIQNKGNRFHSLDCLCLLKSKKVGFFKSKINCLFITIDTYKQPCPIKHSDNFYLLTNYIF
jgi:hypothetical protein